MAENRQIIYQRVRFSVTFIKADLAMFVMMRAREQKITHGLDY